MSREDRSAVAGRIVSELGHELNTPLAAINGFAELLRARDDEHTRREASRHIHEGATRLAKAIDELLETFLADPELPLRFAEARAKLSQRS